MGNEQSGENGDRDAPNSPPPLFAPESAQSSKETRHNPDIIKFEDVVEASDSDPSDGDCSDDSAEDWHPRVHDLGAAPRGPSPVGARKAEPAPPPLFSGGPSTAPPRARAEPPAATSALFPRGTAGGAAHTPTGVPPAAPALLPSSAPAPALADTHMGSFRSHTSSLSSSRGGQRQPLPVTLCVLGVEGLQGGAAPLSPYVQIQSGPRQFRTTTRWNTAAPTWDETFSWTASSGDVLVLTVFSDAADEGADTFLGGVKIPPAQLLTALYSKESLVRTLSGPHGPAGVIVAQILQGSVPEEDAPDASMQGPPPPYSRPFEPIDASPVAPRMTFSPATTPGVSNQSSIKVSTLPLHLCA